MATVTGRPAYFELSTRPKPIEYDPTSVRTPDAGEPVRTALRCARVLLALKLVKPPVTAPTKEGER